jgi:hypothetical protein
MSGIFWILLGVALLGSYSGLMLLDDKTPENDISNKWLEEKWHFVGATFFIYLYFTTWIVLGYEYVPFCISSFWMLFGGLIHVIGLKKHFFFVGTTAKTDVLLRKIFPKNPYLGSAILKVGLFIGSLVYLILKII